MSLAKALILFAKAPVAGQVKTRLTPQLSAQQAATVHQQLIEHCVCRFAAAKDYDFQLYCAPDDSHRFFQYLKAIYGIRLRRQSSGDLGQRMASAFESLLEKYQQVVLIGSDVPAITADYIDAAFSALEKNDVVLGPAEDGGYVLVGLTKPRSEIFKDVRWGSSEVLQQTIEKLQPYSPALLDTLWDVDRAEDVERFKRLLKPRFMI